jgi:hypothetical protein
MNAAAQPRGRVQLFACGGTGMNIASSLDGKAPQDDLAYAKLDITYVDTSRSNLIGRNLDPKRVYLVGDDIDASDDKDGAGKVRKTHLEDIKDCAADILQKHQPGDLTIVVGSASGGSGSVIAPLLARALLKAGKPVIAVLIASTTSVIEITNNIDTLKSYEGIVTSLNIPLTIAYYQNSSETPRSVVNDEVRGLIASLMMLYSRQNAELDTRDLNHWLRFDQAKSSFEPQVTALQVRDHAAREQVEGDVISVATLTYPDKDSSLDIVPEYHCEGFVTHAVKEVEAVLPRHYFVTSNFFSRPLKALGKQVEQIGQQQQARTKRNPILSNTDVIDDSGMVV